MGLGVWGLGFGFYFSFGLGIVGFLSAYYYVVSFSS